MTTQGLENKIKTNNQRVAIILLMNKLQLGIMIPIRNWIVFHELEIIIIQKGSIPHVN